MNDLFRNLSHLLFAVTLLTLTLGCSTANNPLGEYCKTQAYVRMNLEEFLSHRFSSGHSPRLAIIPFSVPANLTYRGIDRPGFEMKITSLVQAYMLGAGAVPIVEILNRPDWPGKNEEFFTGNFGAISMAKEAGYDLILVGMIQPLTRADTMTMVVKVIDIDSGITVYYGKVEGTTWRQVTRGMSDALSFTEERPDFYYHEELADELARCVTEDITEEY